MKNIISIIIVLFVFNSINAQKDLLTVNESLTQVFFRDNQLRTLLMIESGSQKKNAKVHLEVLSSNDTLFAEVEEIKTIERGRNPLVLSIPYNPTITSRDFIWLRLRYTISSEGEKQTGIISMSEIMPELFNIRASSSNNIYPGMNYVVRVKTFHPLRENVIGNVKLDAELSIEVEKAKSSDDEDDEVDDLKIQATGETDENGLATLQFQIPSDAKFNSKSYYNGIITIKGDKNGLKNQAYDSLYSMREQTNVYLNTDKPLYQPNQKIHIRGLALENKFANNSRKAVADKELEFKISDEENTVLYREKVKTSKFGVASIEWEIPDNAKLGRYSIQVGEEGRNGLGYSNFKVSRYELPNFIVKTKNDKDFYLPKDKEAEVTIDAVYLFGKDVAGGKVKIVQENDRNWNYEKQKWDVTEEETYEGETDKDGKFKQKIDLSKTHEKIKDDDDDQFKDLSFSAYFTDSTTNITEQRRFDIRVSREPIHVYLIGLKNYGSDFNSKLPIEFYVSTSSADGKPMSTEVEIKGRYEYDDDKKFKTLTKVKTNKFGAAKVKFDPPKCEENECISEDLQLKITARDGDKIGTLLNENIDIDDDEKQIKIETDKTIFKKGDSMKVEILSSEKSKPVFVDVLRNSSSLYSSKVRIKNGRGKLTIPYNENFKSDLKITAYFDDDGEAVAVAKGIIFPTPKNLRLDVKTEKETYKPAEEATLDFAVTSPDKTFGENAVGVFILDKAVEERALTDSNFGGGFNTFGGLQGLLGNERSFGGITQNDLEELDMSKSISKDVQLAAEVMLENSYGRPDFFSSYGQTNLSYVFAEKLREQFRATTELLTETYKKDFEHPTDVESFQQILSRSGIDFDSFVDPWGNKYKAEVTVNRGQDVLTVWSNGANKKANESNSSKNKDDFVVFQMRFNYFQPLGLKIDEVVADHYKTTGKFVRNLTTLRKVLLDKDFNLDNLKDRWGEPYYIVFDVDGRNYTIRFESTGPNKKLEDYGDDFIIWTTNTDYFDKTQAKISTALSIYVKDKKQFPKTETEFKQALKNGGVIFDNLRDGWGNPLYIESETTKRFADNVKIESVIAKQGEAPKERYIITPVTQEVVTFLVRSFGKDEKYRYRNPQIVQFAGVISEQTKDDAKPKIIVPKTIMANGESAILGTIKDPTGAIIPNADIVLINKVTKAEIATKTNDEGTFLIEKIPAGLYDLRASAVGFKTTVVQNISVASENISQINVSLNVGNVESTVEVTVGVDSVVNTSDASIGTNVTPTQIQQLPTNLRTVSTLLALKPGVTRDGYVAGGRSNQSGIILDGQEVTNLRSGAISIVTKSGEEIDTVEPRKETPRLRNYFPETLLWNPEIVTDANGKASIKFKLADNITTWKIYAIASNLEGKIGVAEKEIRAFQPFFVDLLPPRILTQGDEIFLPVQIRNYTEAKQKVDVEMAKADWFSFLDAEKRTALNVPNSQTKQIEVNKNSTQNSIFGFRADKIIDEGLQKVTAIADKDSDAIEKPVTVKPDGKEVVHTDSEIFTNSVAFDVNFPTNALPTNMQAEVKIYPNLFAHISESVEGLLKRPYGCGEQTISSTYPNLMILKLTRKDNKLRPIAQKYLQKGYERLLGYQVSDNGFSYWGGRDNSNLALTAYALRFLSDASEFIEVDKDVINRTRDYLISQQREDGSWTQYYYGEEKVEDKRRTKQISTYIVRSLAKTERGKTDKNENVQKALTKAFEYLDERNAEIDEPYSLANFGLALLDAGELTKADAVTAKLESMAIAEGKMVYWKLETNTPFYGWGTAGRVETTALVVQLLTKVQSSEFRVQSSKTEEQRPKTKDLQTKGTMFLLKNKDRYGVWHSTQTTINVLEAFVATLGDTDAKNANVKPIAEIFVNGKKVKDIELPPANELGFPLIVRLDSSLLSNLNNRVEIKINGNSTAMMAQTVQNHYISWIDWTTSKNDTNQSRQIRLDYSCDKQKAKPTEEITCDVKAERIGFKGYGMLLAEIGIPPGGDVNRASLEKAKDEDWSFSRYDVLPDRIIIYMWSKAGGTNFKFKFKPRYGINAQTPASFVYDYYNEEAKATVAPMRFEVK